MLWYYDILLLEDMLKSTRISLYHLLEWHVHQIMRDRKGSLWLPLAIIYNQKFLTLVKSTVAKGMQF
jgi:hypothetical protein